MYCFKFSGTLPATFTWHQAQQCADSILITQNYEKKIILAKNLLIFRTFLCIFMIMVWVFHPHYPHISTLSW